VGRGSLVRPVRFIRDEHDCRTWALEQGLTVSREAWGDPPDPEPQRCPVCDGEWHDEDCIFGKEVALRLKAERKTITQRAALRRIAELASATPGQSEAGLGRLLAMIETVAAVELQAP